jgi:hypothetical protein
MYSRYRKEYLVLVKVIIAPYTVHIATFTASQSNKMRKAKRNLASSYMTHSLASYPPRQLERTDIYSYIYMTHMGYMHTIYISDGRYIRSRADSAALLGKHGVVQHPRNTHCHTISSIITTEPWLLLPGELAKDIYSPPSQIPQMRILLHLLSTVSS